MISDHHLLKGDGTPGAVLDSDQAISVARFLDGV
jgi:hypothetical protein